MGEIYPCNMSSLTSHIPAMCPPMSPVSPQIPIICPQCPLHSPRPQSHYPPCLLTSPLLHPAISLLCPQCHPLTSPYKAAMCPPILPLPPHVFPVPPLSLFPQSLPCVPPHSLCPLMPPHIPAICVPMSPSSPYPPTSSHLLPCCLHPLMTLLCPSIFCLCPCSYRAGQCWPSQLPALQAARSCAALCLSQSPRDLSNVLLPRQPVPSLDCCCEG